MASAKKLIKIDPNHIAKTLFFPWTLPKKQM